ncbi:MAG TPA: hypothetical protein VH165_02055 [Kofleriaceae bacterium]|jgi:hypothetical protein|nr:hypothetical protein [Kofleriaceae bacterium]
MPPRVFPPLVEVFVLVEQPRQRLSYWTQALAPLDAADAPPVATMDAYYDPVSNLAIFGLRYDELALGRGGLARIVEVCVLAEAVMIQPAELSEGDRRRFVAERLVRCTEHVGDQRKIVGALVELVRRVRNQKSAAAASLPRRSSDGAGLGAHRGGEPDDPRLVLAAKGTRTVGALEPLPQSTRDLARGSVRQPKSEAVAAAVALIRGIPQAELKRVITEPIATAVPPAAAPLPALFPSTGPISGPVTAAETSELPPELPPARGQAQDRAASPRLSANLVTRSGVHRASTVTMTPLETQRALEEANATQPVPLVTQAAMVEAMAEAGDRLPNPEPTSIYARYLRSGRWVPIRIGALSLKGATLMAGSLPRLDDRVDISLLYGNHRALVRGTVARLSTRQEAVASGATTFTVGFELEDASRRQLTTLLTAARAAKVTLKPPPPRGTQRFPVEWPICLGTVRGAVRADALDVSTDGMFVKPVHALTLEASVTFTSVLDDALAPVSGHARIVRSINDAQARAAGLQAGYGISILDMPASERERWEAFLGRIEKRTSKRVLIGASPARLAELQAGLVAAGYTATGGSDPSAIAQLAGAEARTVAVDIALIDAGWLAASGAPSWVEALFSARNIPCVTMHGDARRARMAIDRLLSVT